MWERGLRLLGALMVWVLVGTGTVFAEPPDGFLLPLGTVVRPAEDLSGPPAREVLRTCRKPLFLDCFRDWEPPGGRPPLPQAKILLPEPEPEDAEETAATPDAAPTEDASAPQKTAAASAPPLMKPPPKPASVPQDQTLAYADTGTETTTASAGRRNERSAPTATPSPGPASVNGPEDQTEIYQSLSARIQELGLTDVLRLETNENGVVRIIAKPNETSAGTRMPAPGGGS